MTNQTNLDLLFKLTAPLSERSAGSSTSSSGRRPAFDDHLVNASTSASGSSSAAGIDTRSAASAPVDSAGHMSRQTFDEDRAAKNALPRENSAASDAMTKPAEEPHEDAEPNIPGADEETANDVAANEDKSNSEQDVAEELAAAALIDGQSAGQLHEELTDEDQVGQVAQCEDESLTSAASSNIDGGPGREAGDLPFGEVLALRTTGDDATAHLEIARSTTPASAGKRAKRSKPVVAGAAGDNPSSDSAADKGNNAKSASTEGVAATIENASRSAKPKTETSTNTGRRTARETAKSTDNSGRGADSGTTQRADANGVQDQASPVAVASGVSAPAATSVAKAESGEEARQAVKPVGHATEGIHMNARAQRAGATAKGRAHAATSDLPRVDTARFVGRVAKAVQTAQERGGLVQLRLSPPELGSMRLELSMKDGVMTAAVETETSGARQILLDHLPALRDRLAEQNIRIERFDVDVRQENSGGQSNSRGSQQEHRQNPPQQPDSRHTAGRSAAIQPPTSDAPHVLTRFTSSDLNLLA
jgi:flagellar hook-length control protein FliK